MEFNKLVRQKQLEKAFLLALLSVSDYNPLDTNFYFIITTFHTELKPQVKIDHGINSPAFTLRPVTRGGEGPLKFFSAPGKMYRTLFETIGHSWKNLGLSQKSLRPTWCPKLVTGLVLPPQKYIFCGTDVGSTIALDQGFPNTFARGPQTITIVRGPEILHNVIVSGSGYVTCSTTKSTNFSYVGLHYFFLIDKMS